MPLGPWLRLLERLNGTSFATFNSGYLSLLSLTSDKLKHVQNRFSLPSADKCQSLFFCQLFHFTEERLQQIKFNLLYCNLFIAISSCLSDECMFLHEYNQRAQMLLSCSFSLILLDKHKFSY